MAASPHGVIKKSQLKDTKSWSAASSILGAALRIPKDHVRPDDRSRDQPSVRRAVPIVPAEETVTTARPFDIPKLEPIVLKFARPEDEPAEPPEEPLPPTPEEIEQAWQTRLEEARKQALEEGREQGRTAAKAEYDADLADVRAQYAQDLHAIQQSWERYLRRAEPQLVELTFRLARAVIDAPIHDDAREIGERAVAEAVERMATDIPVEIVLHPVSYLRIQESGIEDQLNAIHSRLRWRTNPELKQNEWIVQSQRAAARRIEAEIIHQLQRDLNLRDAARGDSAASHVGTDEDAAHKTSTGTDGPHETSTGTGTDAAHETSTD